MGCLPSKGSSTHVAVVHPLNQENTHLQKTPQNSTKNTMFSIEHPEPEDVGEYSKEGNDSDRMTKKMEQTGNEGKPVINGKQTMSDINNKDEQIKSMEREIKESSDTDTGIQEDDDDDEIKEEADSKEGGAETKGKTGKKLTEEEIDKISKSSMEKLKTHIEFIKIDSNREKNEENDYNVKLRNAVLHMCNLYFVLRKASYAVNRRYKTEYFKELASSGAVPILCEISVYILTNGYRFETGEVINSRMKPLSNALSILMNFSDGDPDDAYLIADYPQLLVVFGQKLTEFHEKGMSGADNTGKKMDTVILKKLLCILHNLAMADGNEQKLHSLGFVQILKPYLESSDNMIRLSSLAILADIVNEEDSGILQANPEILKFLMRTLRNASKNKNRRQFGWSVKELCRAIRRIARNDSNKKALVEHEYVELLVTIANGKDVEEQREAVGALRTLSFDKSNQQFFISNTDLGVVETFITQQSSPDKEIRKACEGALWTMRDVLSKNEKYKDSVKHIVSKVQVGNENQGHVMLSYQWGNQKTIIRIKDMLKSNGVKVWMDVEDMAGSTLHAMAKAVENASIVLVCYSQKYKDSDNCRAEAEYAFQLKKKIIPLRMESNYRADGWLGFIIGTKLYYDFGGKYTFESRIEGLLKEVHSKLKRDLDTPDHIDLTIPKVAATVGHEEPLVVPQKQTTKSAVQLPSETEVVKKWSDVQVKQWLDKHSLDRDKFSKLTGIEIAFLQIVRHESSDFFYKSLTDMLKISDLLTVAKFVFALEDTKI